MRCPLASQGIRRAHRSTRIVPALIQRTPRARTTTTSLPAPPPTTTARRASSRWTPSKGAAPSPIQKLDWDIRTGRSSCPAACGCLTWSRSSSHGYVPSAPRAKTLQVVRGGRPRHRNPYAPTREAPVHDAARRSHVRHARATYPPTPPDDVLVHPNTGCEVRDHIEAASITWLGSPHPLLASVFSCRALGCNQACAAARRPLVPPAHCDADRSEPWPVGSTM